MHWTLIAYKKNKSNKSTILVLLWFLLRYFLVNLDVSKYIAKNNCLYFNLLYSKLIRK